jgi:hypothetical protein
MSEGKQESLRQDENLERQLEILRKEPEVLDLLMAVTLRHHPELSAFNTMESVSEGVMVTPEGDIVIQKGATCIDGQSRALRAILRPNANNLAWRGELPDETTTFFTTPEEQLNLIRKNPIILDTMLGETISQHPNFRAPYFGDSANIEFMLDPEGRFVVQSECICKDSETRKLRYVLTPVEDEFGRQLEESWEAEDIDED